MPDVSFEEPIAGAPVASISTSGGFQGLLKKYGIAKNDKEAELVLLGLAGLALITAVVVAGLAFGGSSEPVELPPVPPGTRLPSV